MKAYGQFCPLAQATQILCERWTLIILREMIAGSMRFSDLKKGVPMMSPSLLSTRLKQLIKAGVIEQKTKGDKKYTLTQAGQEVRPMIELLGAWGHRWARSNLGSEDLDASLLMWDMRRTINPEVFPDHRIVVQFEFFDAPTGNKKWWLISENGEIDLCHDDKGHEIDIIIQCSLATMTAVWTCQEKFNDMIKNKKIVVMGDPKLTNNLQDWICSSLLSRLGAITEPPTLQWNL